MSKPEKQTTSVKAIIGWMALVSLVAIVLSFILITTNWLAHFVAVSLFFLSATAILLFYGFHPKSNFIGRKTKLARQSERAQRNAQRTIRCIVVGFAIFLLYFVGQPIAVDWTNYVQHGRPYLSEFKGVVRKNDVFAFGLYFLIQNIIATREEEKSGPSYTAMFFPRLAREGQTNWFLIAPKSGLVLNWQPANESTNPPSWK